VKVVGLPTKESCSLFAIQNFVPIIMKVSTVALAVLAASASSSAYVSNFVPVSLLPTSARRHRSDCHSEPSLCPYQTKILSSPRCFGTALASTTTESTASSSTKETFEFTVSQIALCASLDQWLEWLSTVSAF
jgi:hypothetical protein